MATQSQSTGDTLVTFTRLSIQLGILLILVTVFAVAATQTNFITAYLPAVAGLLLVALGFMGERSEAARAQMMHIASGVGILAFLLSFRVFTVINDPNEAQASIIAQFVTLILSGIYVVLSVRAFMNARGSRMG
jgi:hypothetical protein